MRVAPDVKSSCIPLPKTSAAPHFFLRQRQPLERDVSTGTGRASTTSLTRTFQRRLPLEIAAENATAGAPTSSKQFIYLCSEGNQLSVTNNLCTSAPRVVTSQKKRHRTSEASLAGRPEVVPFLKSGKSSIQRASKRSSISGSAPGSCSLQTSGVARHIIHKKTHFEENGRPRAAHNNNTTQERRKLWVYTRRRGESTGLYSGTLASNRAHRQTATAHVGTA